MRYYLRIYGASRYILSALIFVFFGINACAAFGAAGQAPGQASGSPSPTAATETVAAQFVGSTNSKEIIKNISFTDISGAWSSDVILEGGALGVVKGFGLSAFARQTPMTNAQAIAMVLRASGRESLAQLTGEALETAARAAAVTAGNAGASSAADTVWINGSFAVARDLGLISADEYLASTGDAAAIARTGFTRGQEASRQKFTYWMARALGFIPTRGQQALFNNFADWREADALYIPYLETALAERIITGGSDGRFMPNAAVTREQAAQIVKNASPYVFLANGFEEEQGVVESIVETDIDGGARDGGQRTVFYIRRDSGDLCSISVDKPTGGSDAENAAGETGLVVNINGDIDDEYAIYEGDKIRFVTSGPEVGAPANADGARRVALYIDVLEPAGREPEYTLVQLDSINPAEGSVAYTSVFSVARSSPDEIARLDAVSYEGHAPSPGRSSRRVSGDATYKIGGKRAALTDFSSGMTAIVGVDAAGLVASIETTGIGYQLGRGGAVRGVVEENNAVLGYLSLYGESGARGAGGEELRVYSYVSPQDIEVRKDGSVAQMADVGAGDSAWLMLGSDGAIAAVSATTNYRQYFGTVASVSRSSVSIKYDDGVTRNLELPDGVLYFMDYSPTTKAALTPGATVRVLASDAGGRSVAREVTVARASADRGQAGGIYKARVERIDPTSKKALAYNVMRFSNGRWVKVDSLGFDSFAFPESAQIYAGETLIGQNEYNKMLRDSEAYIVTRLDFGGEEIAERMLTVAPDGYESIYQAAVRQIRPASGSISLTGGPTDITIGSGAIVVKNGVITNATAIAAEDSARVAAVRDDMSGVTFAAVVEIADPSPLPAFNIYRGRVSGVDRDNTVTLGSFSELIGSEWTYANTPKSLAVTYDSALYLADGLTSTRELDAEAGHALIGQAVYVIARGQDIMALSVAPYGVGQTRGEIRSLVGLVKDESGAAVEGPTGVELRDAAAYDRTRYEWRKVGAYGEKEFVIAPTTVVIKDGKIASPQELEVEDRLLVIRGDGSQDDNTAYIAVVESLA